MKPFLPPVPIPPQHYDALMALTGQCLDECRVVAADGEPRYEVSATVTRLPSVAPELCGHTSWSQVSGGPRVCLICCSELRDASAERLRVQSRDLLLLRDA